jgi:hypothetical protein
MSQSGQLANDFGPTVPTSFITDAGVAVPIANTLEVLGGAGTVTSGVGNVITITVGGGGMTWTDVVGVAQLMVHNNGYTANNAGLVTFTLPAAAPYGSIFAVVGKGAGGWRILQQAGQTIHLGATATTAGVGGYLSSNQQYNIVVFLTIAADTTFTVLSSVGNINVV